MDLRGFVASCEYQIFVLQGFASSRNLRRKTRFEEVVVRIFVLLPAMQTRSIMSRAEAQGRRVGKAVVVLWSLCASASLREEILVAAGGRGGLSRLSRSRDSKTVCVAHPTGCRPWSSAPPVLRPRPLSSAFCPVWQKIPAGVLLFYATYRRPKASIYRNPGGAGRWVALSRRLWSSRPEGSRRDMRTPGRRAFRLD
jgi:hypothetical protein